MKTTAAAMTGPGIQRDLPEAPATFLTCYIIANPDALAWPVRVYKVRRDDGEAQSHAERGEAKQVVWSLRKKNGDKCRGYGFVVDIDEETVVVPSDWNLPAGVREGEYLVDFERSLTTNAREPSHRAIIGGILREAIKARFKSERSEALGFLWQDYDRFCQMPEEGAEQEFHFCRRFGVAAKALRGNRWVLQMLITTATLGGRTLANYYRDGEVGALARMIEAKQARRVNRRNRPVAVRVFRNESTPYQVAAGVLELDDPGLIIGHGSLSRNEQAELATASVRCRAFNKPPVDVPMSQLRLILDTQITTTDHSETILEPRERHGLAQQLRDFLHGLVAYGKSLQLAEIPIDSDQFPTIPVRFPALRVRDKDQGERIIAAPAVRSEDGLRQRGRDRLEQVRRHGFLQQRPINPLLAWPRPLGTSGRSSRMMRDLNYLLEGVGIDYRFQAYLYHDVEELARHVAKNGHDAVLAVLPEGWAEPYRDDSTHEKIKQCIEVPSQCIQHDHTLPETWAKRPHREFVAEQPRLAKRIRQRYELCVWNLLVKHHWIPFAPLDAFAYNVHIGLDVGGQHNNRAMACLGYGFAKPRDGLSFRPEEIHIDVQNAEPIPTGCLQRGLLQLFELVHGELRDAGLSPDFDKTLFFRDGLLLGDGNEWNELDALTKVHAELRGRGWVTENSVWTAVEVMKHAEEWRVLRHQDGVVNPLVGYCVLPFDDEDTGLVCTTGAPYLPQGTASPLKFRIVNIHGQADRSEVVRDLVWEADMCFTKPDIGMSLPWVLHVADTGALQLARSYKITGVTA
jgi:hypothetical protein